MNYTVDKNKIVITNIEDFCPMHILECGQVFRFKKVNENYIVYSKDKCAKIVPNYDENGQIISYDIITDNIPYFINYFDLDTDYCAIKNTVLNLSDNKDFMVDAVSKGKGIRILNQDEFEATISFVISQNNNIKRIQLIIDTTCEKFGSNMGEYYAFPSPKQLQTATEQDFKNLGAGYRAKFLVNVIKYFADFDFISFKSKPVLDMEKELLSIVGIGQKVADCIMLFGYHKMEYFPVDTWIEKVYREYFAPTEIKNSSKPLNRLKIRQFLTEKFGSNSGYAQQYLFYYERTLKNIKN